MIYRVYIISINKVFMRTLVDIPDSLIDALTNICSEKHASRAEVIRRAISEYIAKNTLKDVDAFGLWKENGNSVDGLDYQKTVRDEW